MPFFATSKQLAACMQRHAAALGPDTAIIANKCDMLADSRTPLSARGSNEYLGRNIVHGMGFMTPGEHERLLVLNAFTSRDDCVGLAHMDTMNQIAGRNLGYRKREDAVHRLVIHQRLFEYLIDQDVLGWTRYDLVLNLSARQRKHYCPRVTPSNADSPGASEMTEVLDNVCNDISVDECGADLGNEILNTGQPSC